MQALFHDSLLPSPVCLSVLHGQSQVLLPVHHLCGGTCCDISALADMNRRYKIGIAADECVIFHSAAEFTVTVIIYRYHATSNIDMRTKIGVSDVGQMCYAGLFSQCRVFNFHKVSDLDRICQNAVRTQMAVRSDSNAVSYLGFFDEGGMNLASISDLAVFDDGVWSITQSSQSQHDQSAGYLVRSWYLFQW